MCYINLDNLIVTVMLQFMNRLSEFVDGAYEFIEQDIPIENLRDKFLLSQYLTS